MGKPLSQCTKDRIVELAALDVPRTAIAQRLGLSKAVVAYYCPKPIKQKEVYQLRSPNGEIHETDNLNEFCDQHGLHISSLRCVIRKEFKQHKGWTLAK